MCIRDRFSISKLHISFLALNCEGGKLLMYILLFGVYIFTFYLSCDFVFIFTNDAFQDSWSVFRHRPSSLVRGW